MEKIGIIGSGGMGRQIAIEVASQQMEISIVEKEERNTLINDSEVYMFRKSPDIPILPNTEISSYNHKKHVESCIKNRKKRKKKRNK